MFGLVRSRIAPLISRIGERRLTPAATATESMTLMTRSATDSRKKRRFCLVMESDNPRIGHMSGAMIIAPITTEMLSAMSPSVAMTVERMRRMKNFPVKDDSSSTAPTTRACSMFLKTLNIVGHYTIFCSSC